jgi:hypothetical protein
MSPEDWEIRRSLIKALTLALRVDFDKHIDKVQEFESITNELDQPTYLRVVIHGLEKRERWSEALEKMLELSDTRLIRRIDQMMDGSSIEANSRWTIHEDAWIASHIARIAQRIPESDWPSLKPKIQQRLVPDPKQDLSIMRLRLQHFDGLPFTQEARLSYSKSLGNRSMVDAEYLLSSPSIKQNGDESLQ